MKKGLILALLISSQAIGETKIPATPVMSLYQYNGPQKIEYYSAKGFGSKGPGPAVGSLAQGSAVIPCLVMRNGQPLTDSHGTPYVGFEVIMDASQASPTSVAIFDAAVAARKGMQVMNHHCTDTPRYVINGKRLVTATNPPFFDPPAVATKRRAKRFTSTPDRIVRAFHNSSYCRAANRSLVGRRSALEGAWEKFIRANPGGWSTNRLIRARDLDYTMRTAIFESHLGRGCSAYGACERNIIALSIRNRAIGQCLGYQGCRSEGDFQGVSSKVSQYNIWDENFTQTSGLTACFLRNDSGLARSPRAGYYAKLRAIYEQSVTDVEHILFGDQNELARIFPSNRLPDLLNLRHYYHAPAMTKCFGDQAKAEYISAAMAKSDDNYAFIANTRIQVGEKTENGYRFRKLLVDGAGDQDRIRLVNSYPGFVIDGRKVTLKRPRNCAPYGLPPGCHFDRIGRYRKTPSWIDSGKPLEIACRIKDRGSRCTSAKVSRTVRVGGTCDKEMRPFSGIR